MVYESVCDIYSLSKPTIQISFSQIYSKLLRNLVDFEGNRPQNLFTNYPLSKIKIPQNSILWYILIVYSQTKHPAIKNYSSL